MFKGTDIRFSTHTIALLKLYQNIFGKEMWKNVIVEISYWKHTEREACDRISNKDGLDEEKLATALNAKVHIILYLSTNSIIGNIFSFILSLESAFLFPWCSFIL